MEEFELEIVHLQNAKDSLDYDLETNAISEKDYNKCIVHLAYSYAKLALFDDSILTLMSLTEDYFNKYAIIEMCNDAEFTHKCEFLLDIYESLNLVPFENIGNQPLAKA